MHKKLLSIIFVTLILVTGCSGGKSRSSNTPGSVAGIVEPVGASSFAVQYYKTTPHFKSSSFSDNSISNEKIIKVRKGTPESEINQIVRNLGGRIKEKLFGTDDTYLISIDNLSLSSQSNLQSNSVVVSIQDNFIYRALALPSELNNPNSKQWGPKMMYLPRAWDYRTDATDVVVAVVDTGIDITHPDLIDNSIAGKNFIGIKIEDKKIDENDFNDLNGHGTHVAGIIGAYANNGGIAGVAWKVKLMPVRVLDMEGNGNTVTVANGIKWAVANGANIINLSLGRDSSDPAFEIAINNAVQAGVTVIAAAGNDGQPFVYYPAASENVIAVGALDPNGQLASYSNYGPQVDVCAPGTNIYSTYIEGPFEEPYRTLSGTSMACPHISGLAALLYAHGITNPNDIKTRLQTYVIDKGVPGFDNYYGHGMPDAAAVLRGEFDRSYQPKIFIGYPNGTTETINYTDGLGNFIISGISPGTYYLCAFLDKNSDSNVDPTDLFGIIGGVRIRSSMTTDVQNIELKVPAINGTPITQPVPLSVYLSQVLK